MKINRSRLGEALICSVLTGFFVFCFVLAMVPAAIFSTTIRIVDKHRCQESTDFEVNAIRTYLGAYWLSLIFYLTIASFLLLFLTIKIYPFLANIINGRIYSEFYASGLLYTLLTILTGYFIHYINKYLYKAYANLHSKLLEDDEVTKDIYYIKKEEQTTLLLFCILAISAYCFFTDHRTDAFSLLSVVLGYFLWIQPDWTGLKDKVKDIVDQKAYFIVGIIGIAIILTSAAVYGALNRTSGIIITMTILGVFLSLIDVECGIDYLCRMLNYSAVTWKLAFLSTAHPETAEDSNITEEDIEKTRAYRIAQWQEAEKEHQKYLDGVRIYKEMLRCDKEAKKKRKIAEHKAKRQNKKLRNRRK